MGDNLESKNIQIQIEDITKNITNTNNDISLLHSRAQLYTKIQRHSNAINDYLTILKLDPSDKEAKVKLDMLRTIVRYTNTNIYASPNTNMDPWME